MPPLLLVLEMEFNFDDEFIGVRERSCVLNSFRRLLRFRVNHREIHSLWEQRAGSHRTLSARGCPGLSEAAERDQAVEGRGCGGSLRCRRTAGSLPHLRPHTACCLRRGTLGNHSGLGFASLQLLHQNNSTCFPEIIHFCKGTFASLPLLLPKVSSCRLREAGKGGA